MTTSLLVRDFLYPYRDIYQNRNLAYTSTIGTGNLLMMLPHSQFLFKSMYFHLLALAFISPSVNLINIESTIFSSSSSDVAELAAELRGPYEFARLVNQ
jgi:hypothetical protein